MAIYTVTTLASAFGPGSLGEAIQDANDNPGLDTIEFDLGGELLLDPSTVTFVISDDVIIDGDIDNDGMADVTIDAQNQTGIFAVSGDGTDVTLDGLVLENGRNFQGGAVFAAAPNQDLTVINSEFRGNYASDSGGAIYSTGKLTITGSYFYGNTSDTGCSGGAIHHTYYGDPGVAGQTGLSITDSEFRMNTTGNGDGGAIDAHIEDADVVITNTDFYQNTASTGSGGAVALVGYRANLSLTGGTFADNFAYGDGGALNIGLYNGSTTVDGTMFLGNEGYNGGAIDSFNELYLPIQPPAIEVPGPAPAPAYQQPDAVSLTVLNAYFYGNLARGFDTKAGANSYYGSGGAIYSSIVLRPGSYGDQRLAEDEESPLAISGLFVEGTSFIQNVAGYTGGAIDSGIDSYAVGGDGILNQLDAPDADDGPVLSQVNAIGGYYGPPLPAALHIAGSYFYGNTANYADGGAVWSYLFNGSSFIGSDAMGLGTQFIANSAGDDGGAVYSYITSHPRGGSIFDPWVGDVSTVMDGGEGEMPEDDGAPGFIVGRLTIENSDFLGNTAGTFLTEEPPAPPGQPVLPGPPMPLGYPMPPGYPFPEIDESNGGGLASYIVSRSFDRGIAVDITASNVEGGMPPPMGMDGPPGGLFIDGSSFVGNHAPNSGGAVYSVLDSGGVLLQGPGCDDGFCPDQVTPFAPTMPYPTQDGPPGDIPLELHIYGSSYFGLNIAGYDGGVGNGGGVSSLIYNGRARVADTMFDLNYANGGYGGGMYSTILAVPPEMNAANYLGDMPPNGMMPPPMPPELRLENADFTGNYATYGGGGLSSSIQIPAPPDMGGVPLPPGYPPMVPYDIPMMPPAGPPLGPPGGPGEPGGLKIIDSYFGYNSTGPVFFASGGGVESFLGFLEPEGPVCDPFCTVTFITGSEDIIVSGNDDGNPLNDIDDGAFLGGPIGMPPPRLDLVIEGTGFRGNYAYNSGGGVSSLIEQGALVITGSQFYTNTAYLGDGGGVDSHIGRIYTMNPLPYVESAGDGVLSLEGGMMPPPPGEGNGPPPPIGAALIEDSLFDSNSAGYDGGGLNSTMGGEILKPKLAGPEVAPEDVQFGIGIPVGPQTSYQLTIRSSAFVGNTAVHDGGGIRAATIDNRMTLAAVNAESSLDGPPPMMPPPALPGGTVIVDSSITDNTVYGLPFFGYTYGAGGGIANSGDLRIFNSTIGRNEIQAEYGSGGGIDNESGALILVNSSVVENTIAYTGYDARGGGIHHIGSGVAIHNSTVTANSAYIGSGAVLGTRPPPPVVQPGVFALGIGFSDAPLYGTYITNSLVTGNLNQGADPNHDLVSNFAATLRGGNIIGPDFSVDGAVQASTTPAEIFALIDGTTGGGKLADNGGQVETAALLADVGNLAIDTGPHQYIEEPFFPRDLTGDFDQLDTIPFDSRGEGFPRQIDIFINMVGGTGPDSVDLGAFELQILPKAPDLIDDFYEAYEDGPLVAMDVTTNDMDMNGDNIEIVSVDTTGLLGTVETNFDNDIIEYITGGAFQELGVGETAIDMLTYVGSDGIFTDEAKVTITVHGTNDLPFANDDMAETTVGAGPILLDLIANDTDADVNDDLKILAFDFFLTKGQVTLQPDGDTVIWDPGTDFDQLEPGEMMETTFSYLMIDGHGGSDLGLVTIKVTQDVVNQPPVAVDDAASVAEGGPTILIPVTANDSDPDGNPFVVTAVNGAAGNAAISGDRQGILYNPAGQFDGLNEGEEDTDTFTYTITDVGGLESTATVTITVMGDGAAPVPNTPPDAEDDAFATDSNLAVMGSVLVDNGNGADSDADGDVLLLNAVNGEPAAVSSEITLPSGALLKLDADGGFKYDPNDAFDFLGEGETDTDSFTYRIGDLAGGTDTATATIVITGVNDDDPPGEINGDDGDNVFNIENFDMMQTVDGMGGDDSVILPGNLDDFEIEPIDGGFRFTPKGGGEPIDLLSIEIINLDDATLFLDTTAEIRTVSLVYEVFFDRMGDFDGLAFWKDILSSGFTIEEVIDFFPDSIEFNETFGGDLDNKEFVEVLYQNAFGRGGDEEGCEFWAGLLDDGVLDRGDVGLLFAISEEMQQTFANAIDDGVLISA